jgi:endonuclease YncB( thermonuclease family)
MWGKKLFTPKSNRIVFVSPWQMQRPTKWRRRKWIDATARAERIEWEKQPRRTGHWSVFWPIASALIFVAVVASVLDLFPKDWSAIGQQLEAPGPSLTQLPTVIRFPRQATQSGQMMGHHQLKTPGAPRTQLPTVIRFPRQPTQPSRVMAGTASVIDGDTIEIHGRRIRLWGIDAPEGGQPCRVNGEPWRCGQKSALALSSYIGLRTVSCEQRDSDRYGRAVAVCSIGQTPDLGEWLVRSGWALDYPRYSRGAYSDAQREAARTRRGMWQGQFDKPWEWRGR